MTAESIVLLVVYIAEGVALLVCIEKLTLPKLKAYLKERKEKKARQKVAFGDKRKVINENASEILRKAPKMTMEDLEKMCEETPYFVVDYDASSDSISDFTDIKTDDVGNDVEALVRSKDGIVVFD